MEEKLFSTEEAARILDLTQKKIRYLIRRGQIKAIKKRTENKIGRTRTLYFIPESELKRFMSKREVLKSKEEKSNENMKEISIFDSLDLEKEEEEEGTSEESEIELEIEEVTESEEEVEEEKSKVEELETEKVEVEKEGEEVEIEEEETEEKSEVEAGEVELELEEVEEEPEIELEEEEIELPVEIERVEKKVEVPREEEIEFPMIDALVPRRVLKLDGFLKAVLGDIEPGIVLIYGATNSGKTTLALNLLFYALMNGFKCLYIDTEGGISLQRLGKMYKAWRKVYGDRLFGPEELKKVFVSVRRWEHLYNLLNAKLEKDPPDFLVIDSFTNLWWIYFLSNPERRYPIANMRDLLISKIKDCCLTRGMIAVIIVQPRTLMPQEKEELEKLRSEGYIIPDKDDAKGGKFLLFESKKWLYLGVIRGRRIMALRKDKSKPSYIDNRRVYSFRISDFGIEGV